MIKEKKLTSIRLNKNLYARLQIQAKKENRSVNNYIETILLESVSKEPNAETLAAMGEVQEMITNGTGKSYTDADELLKELLDE